MVVMFAVTDSLQHPRCRPNAHKSGAKVLPATCKNCHSTTSTTLGAQSHCDGCGCCQSFAVLFFCGDCFPATKDSARMKLRWFYPYIQILLIFRHMSTSQKDLEDLFWRCNCILYVNQKINLARYCDLLNKNHTLSKRPWDPHTKIIQTAPRPDSLMRRTLHQTSFHCLPALSPHMFYWAA